MVLTSMLHLTFCHWMVREMYSLVGVRMRVLYLTPSVPWTTEHLPIIVCITASTNIKSQFVDLFGFIIFSNKTYIHKNGVIMFNVCINDVTEKDQLNDQLIIIKQTEHDSCHMIKSAIDKVAGAIVTPCRTVKMPSRGMTLRYHKIKSENMKCRRVLFQKEKHDSEFVLSSLKSFNGKLFICKKNSHFE